MTLPREYTPAGMLWISAISMAVGIIAALLTVGIFSGKLEARVTTLERDSEQRVARGEWGQFEKDVRDRLNRIEDKLDDHMAKR